MRWNFAEFARTSPRDRMAASLQGLGATRSNVEVRGPAGNFEQLIKRTLDAPRVPDRLFRGDHLVVGGFNPRVRPIGGRAVEATTTVPRAQVLRGLGELLPGGTRLNILRPPVKSSDALPEPDNSRALPPTSPPPQMIPGSDPVTTNSEAGGTAVTDTTASNAGAATTDAGAAPISAPEGIPTWKLAAGAAALFGGIWYLTRK